MVLFQPTSDPTVWDFSWYGGIGNLFDIVFWIVAILAAAFALLLLADYLNNRKPAHLYWGLSFALIYVNTHILIFSGTFATLLDPVPSVVGALTVGLFAVGVVKSIKPDGTLGKFILYYVLIMSLLIGFVKTPYGWTFLLDLGLPELVPTIVVPVVVMLLHIPSALIIILLPFGARSENGIAALTLSLGGLLMSLVGILLAGALVLLQLVEAAVITEELSIAYLEIVFYAFPFVYLGAGLSFAWGVFVPKQWNFNIPGIELE